MVPEVPETGAGFKAGVKDYRLTYYTPDDVISDTDILIVPPEECGAAESSTGTRTIVSTDGLTSLELEDKKLLSGILIVPPEECGAAVAAESSTGTRTIVSTDTDGLTSLELEDKKLLSGDKTVLGLFMRKIIIPCALILAPLLIPGNAFAMDQTPNFIVNNNSQRKSKRIAEKKKLANAREQLALAPKATNMLLVPNEAVLFVNQRTPEQSEAPAFHKSGLPNHENVSEKEAALGRKLLNSAAARRIIASCAIEEAAELQKKNANQENVLELLNEPTPEQSEAPALYKSGLPNHENVSEKEAALGRKLLNSAAARRIIASCAIEEAAELQKKNANQENVLELLNEPTPEQSEAPALYKSGLPNHVVENVVELVNRLTPRIEDTKDIDGLIGFFNELSPTQARNSSEDEL